MSSAPPLVVSRDLLVLHSRDPAPPPQHVVSSPQTPQLRLHPGVTEGLQPPLEDWFEVIVDPVVLGQDQL